MRRFSFLAAQVQTVAEGVAAVLRWAKGQWVRYSLYALLFLFVILGVSLHSYPLLMALLVVGIAMAVLADKMENSPSDPYKRFNDKHHRLNR
ncbi:hypothetical protein [Alicyclobacillus kakegawensis]|uniref:hypothetical protein n=1 Tax=Alicyclobacillus kakegawensis TaxID=392012 RepID=UPI00082F0189|nr:hypothetical protein [Alicyclobacillus kakegawensis]